MKKNTGFSLVELIIVIAIMAALVAILAPQYTKYVARSRETACLTDISELERECLIESIGEELSGETAVRAEMELLLTVHGGSALDGGYVGFCKSGGKYTVGYDSNSGRAYLSCNEHGRVLGGNSDPAARLLLMYDAFSSVPEYDLYWTVNNNSRLKQGSTLDSTASWSAATATKVKAKFKELGIPDNGSWCVYRKDNGSTKLYDIYLTETSIETLPAGSTVSVTRYNVLTGETETGTMTTAAKNVEHTDYKVLNTASYKADN